MHDNALDLEVLWNFAVALLIGALVGLERERHRRDERGIGVGGLRTFTLVALAGALAAWLSILMDSPWIFAATLLGTAALIAVSYVQTTRHHPDSLGMTTESAALVVQLLAGAVIHGHRQVAVALGVVTAVLLAYKQPLHSFVERLGRTDLHAALRLFLAAFVILPLLPDRTVDPLDALNPYRLWLLVILISALSMVGYVSMRWLGTRRGVLVTALTGGLVSSTAVTLSLARRSKESNRSASLGPVLAGGILLSWLVMVVRVAIEVLAVHRELLRGLGGPLAVVGITTAGLTLVLLRHDMKRASGTTLDEDMIAIKNPFRLTFAVQFAVLFAIVLVLVAVVREHFSGGGFYFLAALAGVTDTDAITLSMAQYARDSGESVVAGRSILVAVTTNSLAKGVAAAYLGSPALRRRILFCTGVVVAAGLGALFLVR